MLFLMPNQKCQSTEGKDHWRRQDEAGSECAVRLCSEPLIQSERGYQQDIAADDDEDNHNDHRSRIQQKNHEF